MNHNSTAANKYLSLKKKKSKQYIEFISSIDDNFSQYFRNNGSKQTKYLEAIDTLVKKLENKEGYDIVNLINITFLLSKLYAINGKFQKPETIEMVKKFVERIYILGLFNIFKKEYEEIDESKRYKYQDYIPKDYVIEQQLPSTNSNEKISPEINESKKNLNPFGTYLNNNIEVTSPQINLQQSQQTSSHSSQKIIGNKSKPEIISLFDINPEELSKTEDYMLFTEGNYEREPIDIGKFISHKINASGSNIHMNNYVESFIFEGKTLVVTLFKPTNPDKIVLKSIFDQKGKEYFKNKLINNSKTSSGSVILNRFKKIKQEKNLKQSQQTSSQIPSQKMEVDIILDLDKIKLVLKKINDICSCIFVDEYSYDKNEFNENSDNYLRIHKMVSNFFDIHRQKPGMLIVCTQNSKSCTNEHFQHLIKEIIEKIKKEYSDKSWLGYGLHLIDKADATSYNNASSLSLSCAKNRYSGNPLPYNCRTRIWGNQYLFSKKYKDTKVIKDKLYKNSLSPFDPNKDSVYLGYFNKQSHAEEIEKRKTVVSVKKCEKRIINISREGIGGILFDIVLAQGKTEIQRFIVCNSNLPKNESSSILNRLEEDKLSYSSVECPLNIIMSSPNYNEFKVGNNVSQISSLKNIFI